VIFIDLDNFKTFNDQHGHLLGDKMLHDFSRVLREHCRRIDVIGRFGGDEFVIVAPQTDSKGALALADKIQHAVTNFPFVSSIADASVHTTCSIGIASLPQDSKRADELLNNADQALYASKRRGKGCTSAWIKPAQTA
jgi:diguanylate cyclase (GGDEF)-like protein